MKTILELVERVEEEYSRHSFVVALEGEPSYERVARIASGLTFWVCAFQDVLRIHEERATEPLVRRIAATLREDDRMHDQWFMHDLGVLAGTPSVEALFSPEQTGSRDVTYALVSELYRAESDYARLALLLVLESCGKVFFSKVARHMERTGRVSGLRWFAAGHARAEQTHEIWEQQLQQELGAVVLPLHVRKEASDVVRRTVAALERLMDHLATLAEPQERVGGRGGSGGSARLAG